MGVEGIKIKPLVKFRMNYGVNDNEISTLYEGIVDPMYVIFDPIEIDEINYYSVEELKDLMRGGNVKFCSWFVELLNWHLGQPTRMNFDFQSKK
jgi:isopentenyldiphosphate isomerase